LESRGRPQRSEDGISGSAGPDGNAERREAQRRVFVGCGCEATELAHGGGDPQRDADHDRDVDIGDAIRLFKETILSPPKPYNARADAEPDGDVDIGDVIKFFSGKIMTRCAVFTFTNETGGAVDDIHIEWSMGAAIKRVFAAGDSDMAGWTNRVISGGGLILETERPDGLGDLANGGQLTIVVWVASLMTPSVSTCQWTLDGVDQGVC